MFKLVATGKAIEGRRDLCARVGQILVLPSPTARQGYMIAALPLHAESHRHDSRRTKGSATFSRGGRKKDVTRIAIMYYSLFHAESLGERGQNINVSQVWWPLMLRCTAPVDTATDS